MSGGKTLFPSWRGWLTVGDRVDTAPDCQRPRASNAPSVQSDDSRPRRRPGVDLGAMNSTTRATVVVVGTVTANATSAVVSGARLGDAALTDITVVVAGRG